MNEKEMKICKIIDKIFNNFLYIETKSAPDNLKFKKKQNISNSVFYDIRSMNKNRFKKYFFRKLYTKDFHGSNKEEFNTLVSSEDYDLLFEQLEENTDFVQNRLLLVVVKFFAKSEKENKNAGEEN